MNVLNEHFHASINSHPFGISIVQSIEFVGIYLIRHQYNQKLYLWETFRVFEWICIDIIASNDRKIIVCLLASLYGKTLSTSLVMVLCFHPFLSPYVERLCSNYVQELPISWIIFPISFSYMLSICTKLLPETFQHAATICIHRPMKFSTVFFWFISFPSPIIPF